jgi:hypothetical protein
MTTHGESVWLNIERDKTSKLAVVREAERYAYHTTSVDRLPRIQAHGLVPGAMPRYEEPYSEFDDGHHFFFYDDLAQVTNWPGDVVLRFPRPADAKQNVNKYGRALPGQFATKTPVPPSAIEIGRANGRWTPLVERSHPARARAAREEELPPDAAQARDHARQVLWPTIDVGDPIQYDVGFWPGSDDSWVDAVVAHFDRDQGIDLIYVDFPFGRDTEVFDDEWRDRIRPAHTMVAQAPAEAGRRKLLRIDKLICARTSIQQVFADIEQGRLSRTTGPLSVWYAPEYHQQPVRGYLLTDGHHRLVEQLLRGTAAPFTWEEVSVRQIGSGYTDYWATPAPEDRVVFAASRFGGLESIFPFERLEAASRKLAGGTVAEAPVEDRKQGAYRGWEHRRERDEAVRVNLDPSLWPLWDRIGGQFRGTPEEREAEFLEYVHDHPGESVVSQQADADKKLDDLIAQRLAGAPARKFAIGDRVLVRPKYSRGFPTGPGEIHDIANGKYEIRWTGGEYGWFASSDLRDVSTETQAPVARATEETIVYRGVYFDIITTGGEKFLRIGSDRRLKNAGPFATQDEAIQAAHDQIDEMLAPSAIDPDTSRQGRGALPMRPKPPNPIALHQLAAAFISDIEDSKRSSWKDKLGDPRVPKIVAALQSLGFQDGIGPVLGHGAFGTACMLPDGRVLKLTSDPSEVQAGYALLGKTLPHVVAIYGAWFVRGVKIRTTLTVDQDSNPVATRMWPMGIGIVEKVTPLDRTTTAFQGLTGTIIAYKREHNLFPEHLTKIGPARARALLKASSEGMERVLRENAVWLRKNDMVDDAYLAEGVADALKETRALGVYAIDVHGGNVGYVEDAKGDRTYKIFDIGSSSVPGTPHAPTVPEGGPARGKKKEADVDPTHLSFPGMLAEPQPVPWVGDEDEAPRQRRRRA